MHIRVRFFHHLRDVAGRDELDLDLPDGARLLDVKAEVLRRYPGLQSMGGGFALAQNMEWADPTDLVVPEAEIALMPPVSGG